jgi:predicted Rossmann fold nucleotide-binding protein DprA/Smf involved in DNA uptake
MVVNTKIEIKNKEIYEKIKLISNKSVFKILELTQDEELTIDEIVREVKIAKAKVESHLINMHILGLISKTKHGKYVKIKSKINLDNLIQ